MANRIQRQVRDRPVVEGEVVDALNREHVPLLRALRSEFNSLLPADDDPAYTVTNPVTRRTFDTTTVTTQQLAEVVGTLLAELQSRGALK